MKNYLVNDSNCNVVNVYAQNYGLQGMTNNVRFTFSVGGTTRVVCN